LERRWKEVEGGGRRRKEAGRREEAAALWRKSRGCGDEEGKV
jgi:hypothetical protein